MRPLHPPSPWPPAGTDGAAALVARWEAGIAGAADAVVAPHARATPRTAPAAAIREVALVKAVCEVVMYARYGPWCPISRGVWLTG
ncbi:hypothetical protein GCM10010260_26350 [Streptomyces filipinensis]|uniref:Uncharacterized protein n=1 Tax=Streptomyces filipinensis TaxID=66887 RepID=A0A918M9X9_9ACTN|nr:hypothetical protein GCM10010260_26350 [Streptomyces filipinensis]